LDTNTAFLASVPHCRALLYFNLFKLIMPYTPLMIALWTVAVCKLVFGYNEVTIRAAKFGFGRLNKYQFLVLAGSHRELTS
jgi:hypothetical protein